jgi:hypothetical protein
MKSGPAIGLLLSVFALPALANTPSAEDSLNRLTLSEGVAPTGELGGLAGTADAAGHRILVEDLSVVQPVRVAVVALDPSKPVRVSLVKGGWDEPLESGTTDAGGQLIFNARTEGNMGILVQSAAGQPAEYRLAVWVGPEMPGEPPTIFKTSGAAALDGDEADASRTLAWMGGAALLVLVLVGAFLMGRRSRARNQAVVVLCLALAPFLADAQLGPQPKPQKLGTGALKEMLEKNMVDNTKKGYEKLTNPQNWDPKKWKDAFNTLAPEDAAYDEDYDPPGMPELPLDCAESDKCAACFEPAYERLKNVRIRFEKLRRLYAWTKAYKERAFALGDSAAGIHGIAGLAWVGERVELERSYQRFEGTYDDKYAELLDELRGSLEQIAQCEEEVYGEEDWFNRFGFIYFQFMADRYKRA